MSWRGPRRVLVVGCMLDLGPEAAGIRASSGRVILKCRTGIHISSALHAVLCNAGSTELPCVVLALGWTNQLVSTPKFTTCSNSTVVTTSSPQMGSIVAYNVVDQPRTVTCRVAARHNDG